MPVLAAVPIGMKGPTVGKFMPNGVNTRARGTRGVRTHSQRGAGCRRAGICGVVEELRPSRWKRIRIAIIWVDEAVEVASCTTSERAGFEA